jgi:hypothetical protein
MSTDDHVRRVLLEAADLPDEPMPDVGGIVAIARRRQRRRAAALAGAVGLVVVLVLGIAVAQGDSGRPDGLSTVDAPDGGQEDTGRRSDPGPGSTTTALEEAPSTTTTGADVVAGEGDDAVPPPSAASGPLRLVVEPAVASYAPVAARSADPCPSGTQWVDVQIWGVGGSTGGSVVGGVTVRPDAGGVWSVEEGIAAVGRIDGVAWAMTADDLAVRASCLGADRRRLADYEPAQVRLGAVPAVPELTASWDGTTVTVEYSGCPTSHQALVSWGASPPPSGASYAQPYTARRPIAGDQPGTWVATIEVPDRDPGDGLWATAFCDEPSGVTSIWRYLPVELDPPG